MNDISNMYPSKVVKDSNTLEYEITQDEINYCIKDSESIRRLFTGTKPMKSLDDIAKEIINETLSKRR